MIQAMKDLIKIAEGNGFRLVKYDEYQQKLDQELTDRFLLVFEKE